MVYKAAFIHMLFIDPFFAAYGLLVSGYIVSRFVISLVLPLGASRTGWSRTSRS